MLKRFIIGFLLANTPLCFSGETVTLRADYWFPYNGDPNSSKPGYLVEIAKRAFAAEGIQVDYQLMPWKGALVNTKNGNIDCVLGASALEARDLLLPKQKLGTTDTGFYARVGEIKPFKYQGLASLRPYRIGMVEDAVHIEDPAVVGYLEKYQATEKVYLSKDHRPVRDLMAQLLANNIDIVIETPAVFKAVAQDLRLHILFEELDVIRSGSPIYIACSKKNPKSAYYLTLLDKAVMQMRANGQLDSLLKRYGLTDWQ